MCSTTLWVALGAALAFAIAPVTAGAATVSATAGVAVYESNPGEADHAGVAPLTWATCVPVISGSICVRDYASVHFYELGGSRLEAGNGCTRQEGTPSQPPRVVCRGVERVVVHLRDGDDRFYWGGPLSVEVHGEAGNDTLDGAGAIERPQIVAQAFGGSGNDVITGGTGPDLLEGGSGSDTIAANGGTDEVRIADGEADNADCGDSGDVDVATADAQDALDGCEHVERPPDSTPPDTTIESGPRDPSNEATPTFTFRATEADVTFRCRLDGGTPLACSSPYRPTGLSEGPHRFEVWAVDRAGNADDSPAAHSWRLDTTRPQVLAVLPADAATNVATGANVEVTFSETMDSAATQQAFSLEKATDGSRVSGSAAWSDRTLVFDPTRNLARDTQYRATVTTAARDPAGNALAAARSWTFRTGRR